MRCHNSAALMTCIPLGGSAVYRHIDLYKRVDGEREERRVPARTVVCESWFGRGADRGAPNANKTAEKET